MHGLAARSRANARGITIVEILIVVACFALLAGILLPILSHIREVGYRTKCASQMLQFASAFQTYSQDWSDYLPCPGGLRGDDAYWHQSGQGGLMRYVKQSGHKSIWCCPKMPEWKSEYPARSYCMNSYLREPADIEYYTCTSIRKGIRITNIPRMNQTILIFEGLPLRIGFEKDPDPDYVYIYRCCNWTGVKGYSALQWPKYSIDPGRPWHGRVSNYIYCDGHLVVRRPGTKTVGLLSTHKEMYDWYVDKGGFETVKWPKYKLAGAPYQ